MLIQWLMVHFVHGFCPCQIFDAITATVSQLSPGQPFQPACKKNMGEAGLCCRIEIAFVHK